MFDMLPTDMQQLQLTVSALSSYWKEITGRYNVGHDQFNKWMIEK